MGGSQQSDASPARIGTRPGAGSGHLLNEGALVLRLQLLGLLTFLLRCLLLTRCHVELCQPVLCVRLSRIKLHCILELCDCLLVFSCFA